jgi:hypothetical protein
MLMWAYIAHLNVNWPTAALVLHVLEGTVFKWFLNVYVPYYKILLVFFGLNANLTKI